MKKGMIKISVFYPNTEGKKFDMKYYLDHHVPLVSSSLGDVLQAVSYESGLAGGAPGAPAPFVAGATMFFNTMEEFGQAFAAASGTLMADLPNFTEIEPVIQISEVMA